MLPLFALALAACPLMGQASPSTTVQKAAWEGQLGKTWVITEGWTGMVMHLATPTSEMPEDDWIGLIFRPDGEIYWEALRPIDPSEGCSNSFGGFRGTWTREGSTVRVELVELTRSMSEYPATLVVQHLDADRLVLEPVP